MRYEIKHKSGGAGCQSFMINASNGKKPPTRPAAHSKNETKNKCLAQTPVLIGAAMLRKFASKAFEPHQKEPGKTKSGTRRQGLWVSSCHGCESRRSAVAHVIHCNGSLLVECVSCLVRAEIQMPAPFKTARCPR